MEIGLHNVKGNGLALCSGPDTCDIHYPQGISQGLAKSMENPVFSFPVASPGVTPGP